MNEQQAPRLTPEQKRVVVVLAALTGVLLLALVVALVMRDDPDDSVVIDATTTTTATAIAEETSTTIDLPSSTTAAPTTTTKPTTTTTAAPKPAIDGRGAVLVAPPTASRREMAGNQCASLAESGSTAECGLFTGKGSVEMAWLVEQRDSGRRAFVLRKVQGRQWNVVLEARDDSGARFADVNVRVVDVSGDGAAEAVFGFRRTGTTEVLAVDVVEAPGRVVVHRESPKGSVRLSPGQLDLWEATGSQYDHLTVRFADNAWRIVANVKVSPADVPPSQL